MRIVVSAGEPSGDSIGADLADGFRQILPGAVLAGSAGPKMERRGVLPLANALDFSHSGWSSVLVRLPWLAVAAWSYFRSVARFAPDLVVAVDAPGLNGPLLRRCQKRNIAIAWVAPPQLWAWKNRTGGFLRGMRVYPAHGFEVDVLARAGALSQWWGYPGSRPILEPTDPPTLLALFPGSRPAWRIRHTQLFLEASNRAGLPLDPVLVHPHPPRSGIESGYPCRSPRDVLPRAALALSLPGTATLETAMWGVPTVVAAKPSALDLYLAKRSLAAGPRALPNRILGRSVFPELYGRSLTADSLGSALADLFGRRQDCVAHLKGFQDRLGSSDAVSSIVKHILNK